MITSTYLNPRHDIILAERGGVPVIVDVGYRRCTAFIFIDKAGADGEQLERTPIATVFFLEVPLDLSAREDAGYFIYAITVSHAVKSYDERMGIFIRVNKKGGGYKDIETRKNDWIPHPKTDIAVRKMSAKELENTDADHFQYDFISPYDEGTYSALYEGDDIFSIGLFTGFYGSQRIQPIVRFGKIALQPYEQIEARLNLFSEEMTPIDAYLIEMDAWEGQSGSPVFAYFSPGRIQGMSTAEYERFERRPPCIMGVIQGYYPDEIESLNDKSVRFKLNMGIAAVIPAQKIIDTLMQKELVEDRKRALASRPKPKISLTPASSD